MLAHVRGLWMRPCIGLAVARDEVRGVFVHRGEIVTSAAVPVDRHQSLDDALRELLQSFSVRRWHRPVVVAVIGPAAAQTRKLGGLPAVDDPVTLETLVRESAGRFFLKNGIPIATTGVKPVAPHEAWVAAFDQPVVTAVQTVCAERRLRLTAVAPTVVVLAYVLENRMLEWHDGDVVAEVSYGDDGELVAVRRVAAAETGNGGAIRLSVAVPALATLGPEAWRHADSFGATLLPPDEPLVLCPGRGRDAQLGTPSRWRLGVAALACTAGLVAAAVTPILMSELAVRDATRRLAAQADRRSAAVATERALESVTRALREVSAFDSERRSMTLFLASVTTALPLTTSLVALRTDSTGGTITALAPRGAAVLNQLEGVREIVAPALLGPVTPELSGTAKFERVTIRFRWRAAGAGAPRLGSRRATQ